MRYKWRGIDFEQALLYKNLQYFVSFHDILVQFTKLTYDAQDNYIFTVLFEIPCHFRFGDPDKK